VWEVNKNEAVEGDRLEYGVKLLLYYSSCSEDMLVLFSLYMCMYKAFSNSLPLVIRLEGKRGQKVWEPVVSLFHVCMR